MKLICKALALTLALLATPVQALEAEARDGGVWFPAKDAEKILHELKKVPDLEKLVEQQDQIILEQKKMVVTSTKALAQSKETTQLVVTELQRETLKVAEQEAELNSPLRNPIIMFGSGVVAASLVVISLLIIAK